MPQDENAPATKKDVQLLMQEIGKLYAACDGWKDEILHEFRIVVEDMRHDMIGTHKDRIGSHEDRLLRLERHAGF
jgi:hypothetical protein